MRNDHELKTDPFEDEEGWYQRQLELRRMYEEMQHHEYSEEEMLDRRARAQDINSIWKALLLSNRR
jgi:hypothetical protein